MRCPVCGSTDTRKSGRSGEYFCNSCVSYFDVVDSAWHGNDKSTRRCSKRSNPQKGNRYQYVDNHAVETNRKVFWGCFIFVVVMILLPVFFYSDFYKNWVNKRFREELEQRIEKMAREKAAIKKMEALMLVPYYSYKSEFEAQKDRVLPINIMNIEMNMPVKNLENYKGPEMERITIYDREDALNSFYIQTKKNVKFFGAKPHSFDGYWEDGKVIRVYLYYSWTEDSLVTENVKKWAGKGYYTEYEGRYPKYTWEYKNVNIILHRSYNGNSVFLELSVPGFDYEKLEKEKKDRYEKNRSYGSGKSSASSSSSYRNSSSYYEKREKWVDEQEEEEYDDEYDEEYGW